MMRSLAKYCLYLAIALATGCSVFKSAPAPVVCPEPVACPVCPSAEPLVQQCPEPQVVEKIVTVTAPAPVPPKAATAGELNLPIVGAVESVTIEPGNVRLRARIDTGSAYTTLQARDIQLVEKDGKRWVHFSVLDPATKEEVKIEQRLRRKRTIKQSDGDVLSRYAVHLWLTVGSTRSLVDVYLSDRDNMEYPLVIGRNLLVDNVIVDVSRN